jgi:hypothetical protein
MHEDFRHLMLTVPKYCNYICKLQCVTYIKRFAEILALNNLTAKIARVIHVGYRGIIRPLNEDRTVKKWEALTIRVHQIFVGLMNWALKITVQVRGSIEEASKIYGEVNAQTFMHVIFIVCRVIICECLVITYSSRDSTNLFD